MEQYTVQCSSSLRSMAVCFSRAHKQGSETVRRLKWDRARFRGFASQRYARQNRHSTQAKCDAKRTMMCLSNVYFISTKSDINIYIPENTCASTNLVPTNIFCL